MLAPRYENASTSELVRLFGPEFEIALRGAPVGEWFGPVTSGYGTHLVRIESREAERTPELAEVRESVARDLNARRRQSGLDAQYQTIRDRYRIRVESAGP
jgi:parvulin-like peptidyl-prolyl isomerase